MLQRCRIVGKSANCDIQQSSSARLTPRPVSDREWKPFNLVQKRSGPHNLSRTGYDEEKCRNVLVRFCAHVPRNYQYKDGIQQVFLILREHLGDENLDLAGGVLYELIEVDCEHSDDPGASFQRWRHDHMCRYTDFELPHIPHMTTITSSIIPTQMLSRWRSEHPERYRFVLSDSATAPQQASGDQSCIRSKKAWLIDHTLYVSTRFDGTRPLRNPNPKEFHEMQWNPEYGGRGRFVEERELPIVRGRRPSEASSPENASTPRVQRSRSQKLRHSLSSISIIEKIADKMGKKSKEPELQQRRRSWIPGPFTFESGPLFKDRRSNYGTMSVPLPEGLLIPNAIFARKFMLVDEGENLPPNLPISQMPTAESKATDTIVEAATTGLLTQAPPWLFRGPFTPQLGFDGGLDFQWNPQDSEVIIRRFDLDALSLETSESSPTRPSKAPLTLKCDEQYIRRQSPSKRRGRVFDNEGIEGSSSQRSGCFTPVEHSPHAIRGADFARDPPISPPYTPDSSHRPLDRSPKASRETTPKMGESRRRNARFFGNIEFTLQTELSHPYTPVPNRKTTVIERSGQIETALDEPNEAHCEYIDQFTRGKCSSRNLNKMRHRQVNPNSALPETPRELLLSTQPKVAYDFKPESRVPRRARVSHGRTGEVLQPLRYNASGGGKGLAK